MPAVEMSDREQLGVMDGSMGRLCQLNGVPEDNKLWSARGLVEERYHPIVIEAHMEYIQAGSTMITTNNYAVQPQYYRRVYEDWEARIPRDTELAARLAVEARTRCGATGAGVRVLGCLPPICESHRPDLTAQFIREEGDEACIGFYRTIGQALLRGGADALIAETLNSWEEARLAIEATKDLGVPLLISLEGALRTENMKPQPHLSPEIAERILEAKAEGAPIEALGFNCAPPEDILQCLQAIEASGHGSRLRDANIRLAVYANCNDRKAVHDAGFDVRKFVTAGPIRVREDLLGSGYVQWCHEFIRAGAQYCGGCCGCTPEEIRELSSTIADVDWALEPLLAPCAQDNAEKLRPEDDAAEKMRLENEASSSTVASEDDTRSSLGGLSDEEERQHA